MINEWNSFAAGFTQESDDSDRGGGLWFCIRDALSVGQQYVCVFSLFCPPTFSVLIPSCYHCDLSTFSFIHPTLLPMLSQLKLSSSSGPGNSGRIRRAAKEEHPQHKRGGRESAAELRHGGLDGWQDVGRKR